MPRHALILLTTACLALAGCDQLGIESAATVAAKAEAEGKAIGAGCRHAARSVEVCYEMNKRIDKAAIFAGWREMNDYMRENKIEAQPAVEEPTPAVAAAEEAPADPPAAEPVKPAKAPKKAH